MTKLRIVAAVVDTRRLTLYTEDGEQVKIPQGDERVQRIIDETKEDLILNKVCEVDISIPGEEPETTYRDFEEKSGGLVKFFRVAKNVVTRAFGGTPEPVDNTPNDDLEPAEPLLTLGDPTKAKLDNALNEIMANAKPVTDDSTDEMETVVAVVGNKPITGVEAIKDHMAYANKVGSPEGVKAFLKRIAAVIDDRRHSIEDLLRFMERADLPIADDGTIVVYKVLRKGDNGRYVDCHTGKVSQGVGSFVSMDQSLVDPDRRQQCSNGLHVARRGYLRSFGGDLCVMAKVAPEDVIAVPSYDANKVRVCGYHILFELTGEMWQTLRNDRPMTSNKEGQKLLAKALSGNHPAPIEDVRITQQKGGGVVITPRGKAAEAAKPAKPSVRRATAIERPKPKEKVAAPAVDPKSVNQSLRKSKTDLAPPTGTRAQVATAYMYRMKNRTFSLAVRLDAAEKLLAHRKKSKVGWARLDLPDWSDSMHKEYVENLTRAVEAQAAKEPAKPTPKAKPVSKPKAKTKPAKKTTSAAKVKNTTTVADEARAIFDQKHWNTLAAFKRKKKKSWTVLGFNEAETKLILSKI